MTSIADFVYFAIIYGWIDRRIKDFGEQVMGRTMVWVSGVALTLITLWILIQGWRMITGQSREPMMAMVSHMGKIAVTVTVASTMALGNVQLMDFFTTDLQNGISELVTGSSGSPESKIDQNLAYMQVAMSAIDEVQVPAGDSVTADAKARSILVATLGTAGPAMAAGAMLLFYKMAIALCIGLGPLFILCLIFDQTKDLFRRWLMYSLGTLFSIAVLSFVVSLATELMVRIAVALWGSSIINNILDANAAGFSNQALQQGGVGLLMTVLIVSTPPMAAAFFNGTMGHFTPQPAFTRMPDNRGANGQMMSGGGYGGSSSQTPVPRPISDVPQSNSGSITNSRPPGTDNSDVIKPYPGPGIRV
jgi:type IV secretion system protein VirB6